MANLHELDEVILSFSKDEFTSIEVKEKAESFGLTINSNFWNALKSLEKYGSIKIDDERKPWMIRRNGRWKKQR